MYKFADHQAHWRNIPVDDVGYISAEELLSKPDDELEQLIAQFENNRYSGWRNTDNKWRTLLGLDATKGKRILDFGCGFGMESLQFTRNGNTVYSADINEASVKLATRVAGSIPLQVTGEYPFWEDIEMDIFYANGVLHHIPYARQIIERAIECGAKEFRLMLYSDKGWEMATGVKPGDDEAHREAFASYFDFPGVYADWYSAEKLKELFGDILTLKSFDYIAPHDQYSVSILEAK